MRLEQHVTIAAPPEEVWEAVCDPVALGEAMGSGMIVEPLDPEREAGLGARYRVLVSVGAALAGGNVEIVEFDRPRDLAWVGFTGVSHRLRLRLRPEAGGTRLTLRFAYDAPGILGTVADLAALPRVRQLLEQGLRAIKHEVEEGSPPPIEPPSLPARVLHELGNVAVLARAGIIAPMRPDKLPRLGLAALAWGPTLAAALAAGAIRHPERAVVEDEQGEVSYAEMHERTDAVACGLRELGIAEGDSVGLMARNHRGFIEAAVAVAKVGADVLLLNTAFSGPQLTEVCERERPSALIYDAEFAELLADAAEGRVRVIADEPADAEGRVRVIADEPADAEGRENGDRAPEPAESLASLRRAHAGSRPQPPERSGRVTILTSGTTGTPKGASRGATGGSGLPSLDAPAGLLERIPLREGMRIGLAAPMFHAWGLANLALGLGLGATHVLARKFDPEAWLARIERSRVQALIVVPVMMQRILALDEQVRRRYDTSSLQVVAASGSALPGDLSTRWMDEFGDTLYNMYGSTEVASATIATPEDMRAAPGTAGRPTRGTTVKLLDDDGHEVPQGEPGRIFVGNSALFEGYTGGGDKQRVAGLVATGDIGRFDEAGRLFVEGRDDEMIVSGGENVFPKEVEDVLAKHPAVAEAAAIGVPDEDFGQRLRAFVALRDGQSVQEEELKKWVRDQLARYKVPREIRFVDELPRNATGKVLKRELDAD
jgi:acyl-CoA synthetase (AMP-forming)/AMP-acid ligase II/carbon monoxide dehydrogenase subunit G